MERYTEVYSFMTTARKKVEIPSPYKCMALGLEVALHGGVHAYTGKVARLKYGSLRPCISMFGLGLCLVDTEDFKKGLETDEFISECVSYFEKKYMALARDTLKTKKAVLDNFSRMVSQYYPDDTQEVDKFMGYVKDNLDWPRLDLQKAAPRAR